MGRPARGAAHASLSKCLSNLHDLVGDAVLIERQTISFNRKQPYQLDTERFAAGVGAPPTGEVIQPLQAALALYRGDFWQASMCATHRTLNSGCWSSAPTTGKRWCKGTLRWPPSPINKATYLKPLLTPGVCWRWNRGGKRRTAS